MEISTDIGLGMISLHNQQKCVPFSPVNSLERIKDMKQVLINILADRIDVFDDIFQ